MSFHVPTLNCYRLYLVTDPVLHAGYTVLEQVEQAARGGVKMIQIREKSIDDDAFVEEAKEARKITRQHGAWLIINDRPDIMVEAGADGLHIGQDDISLKEARKICGNEAIIGVSVHNREEAIKAESEGADYLAVNGIFYTDTKRDIGKLPGLRGAMEISRVAKVPVVGIGGIKLDNAASVIATGIDGVAVVTAITKSKNIQKTCKKFFAVIDNALESRD